MVGFGIGVIVVLDWRPVNSEADLESDDRHLLEALQDGPSPQAGEINDLVRIVLLALLCAFDLAFLLEHFLGGLFARTSGGTDVVVKSALGH